jgi:hypothetical protein
MSHFALLMAELIMKLGKTGGKIPPANAFSSDAEACPREENA